MIIRLFYLISGFVSLVISLIPIFFAVQDASFSSYCDSEVWHELGRCTLDGFSAILGILVIFTISFIFLIGVVEFFACLARRSKAHAS